MSSTPAERPATLKRRRPQPAPDENVDPVAYSPSPTPSQTPQAPSAGTEGPADGGGPAASTQPSAATAGTANAEEKPVRAARKTTKKTAPAPAGEQKRGRGRPPGREVTVQLSTRISLECSQLLEEVKDAEGETTRATIESAIRAYAASR